MRKVTILIIIVFLVIVITGCIYDGAHPELYKMTRCNALATNGVGESEWVITEVIEEDSYGRILFSYTMNVEGVYYGYGQIWVLAICQKFDKKLTYYYEDMCFILSDEFEDFSEEDIKNLKINNDWDKPLNEEKMSNRPIHGNYNGYSGMLAHDIITEGISIAEGVDVSVTFVDYDGTDKILCLAYEYDANKYDGIMVEVKYYLMIINEDGSYNEDTYLIEFNDFYNYQKLLHKFKLDNGWSFS